MQLKKSQINKIAKAYAVGKENVRNICIAAYHVGDLDLIEYISDNYADCFTASEQKDLKRFVQRIKLAKLQRTGNDTLH